MSKEQNILFLPTKSISHHFLLYIQINLNFCYDSITPQFHPLLPRLL